MDGARSRNGPELTATLNYTKADQFYQWRHRTFRRAIKPDLWSDIIRLRFSNNFEVQPVTLGHAIIAEEVERVSGGKVQERI